MQNLGYKHLALLAKVHNFTFSDYWEVTLDELEFFIEAAD